MFSRTEKLSLIFGWIALGLGIAGGLLLRHGVFDRVHGRGLCVFRRVTGYYCPGCGLTRACFALANGQILRSFLFHPFLLLCVVTFLLWLFLMTERLIRAHFLPEEKRYLIWKKNLSFYAHLETAAVIFAAVLLLQWLIKILLQLIWHLDWFEMIGKHF
ncbi:MAG: DUF2752 domain-containing protein [Lachnospiraceae bacterium]|nr:DUF2752 domain-containing protein [Lachnospiraceae bacterium]